MLISAEQKCETELWLLNNQHYATILDVLASNAKFYHNAVLFIVKIISILSLETNQGSYLLVGEANLNLNLKSTK